MSRKVPAAILPDGFKIVGHRPVSHAILAADSM